MQNRDEWQSDKSEQKLKALLPTQKIVKKTWNKTTSLSYLPVN